MEILSSISSEIWASLIGAIIGALIAGIIGFLTARHTHNLEKASKKKEDDEASEHHKFIIRHEIDNFIKINGEIKNFEGVHKIFKYNFIGDLQYTLAFRTRVHLINDTKWIEPYLLFLDSIEQLRTLNEKALELDNTTDEEGIFNELIEDIFVDINDAAKYMLKTR